MKNMAKVVDDPIFRNKIHVFDDRLHAGELLSEKLEEYGGKKHAYVLARALEIKKLIEDGNSKVNERRI